MVSVERLVNSWSRIGLLLLVLLGACNSAHIETSTETGNPPVIDLDKVSLVVSADGVRIVGEAGAITPGGAEVELSVIGSSEVARGPSKPDGSFDIPLDAGASAVVEVRAKDGDQRSPSVYVTRGGATVGSGQNSQLSCMERSNLASQAIGNALGKVDASCSSDADCMLVSYRTVCTDTCSDAPLSSAGATQIEKAVMSIEQGLCGSFAADGCQVIAQPCVPPPQGPLACVAGKCTQTDTPTPKCPSCLDQTLSWGPTNNFVRYQISGCDDLSRVQWGQPDCTSKVPHCGSGASPTLEDLITALAHPDVQKALSEGTSVGGPPPPGGLSTIVTLGDRSFVRSTCDSGSNCAEAVVALTNLLGELGNEIVCEQPTCPPNANWVTDVCLSCGPAGGCGETAARCAVLCSDPGACTKTSGEISCSGRGICEATGCI